MPQFSIPHTVLDLRRNIALVDTNVLVAYVDKTDALHEQATLFIDEHDFDELIVTPPVIVETCGLLSKRGKRPIAEYLLSWLLTPGHVRLFPNPHSPADTTLTLHQHSMWMKKTNVDYVDAYLMEVAHCLTTACDFRPHVPIITFDTGDYIKCMRRDLFFSVYDMRDFQLIEVTA
ncbi:MAG: PIN domain-containing protein [Ferrovibrio sp.]|uniref:PIN domain-containing protein n=1 Tax=Ferrovibrio sp. TaxID=1917215 RepID=UPI00391CA549